MSDPMRTEWIRPVLEDIRDFLRECEHPEMAHDIDKLIERYKHTLDTRSANEDALPGNAIPLDLYRPRR
ncbi:hypothetical protein [Roseivivax sediminis]|uniref:Uncharacterized protein n=1 Tax=Roseivivax sediminis TaxID=936889 RepID=A0A1I1STV0_9RHOB|nr:hypothetical protein [Roseivivax sediminis]SFD47323.1 hypothetical protein SAMN04515678_101225 [Roseivivax sediminis]